MSIRLALAEDHEIVRRGLRTLIDGQPDMILVGEATTGTEVQPLLANEHPDVLLLDLMMPGLTGLDLLPALRHSAPQTNVLVFTMFASDRYVVEALRHGAIGYVTKDAENEELIAAVHSVAQGQRFLSTTLPIAKVEALLAAEEPADPLATLTPREREVFCLAVRGLTSARIAEQLFLSDRTVEKHRAAAMHKLGLKSQNDAVRYAYTTGLLALAPTEGD